MWALPNISSMNASKVVKQADYKRQLNLGRSIKHRCDSCNKPSVWHYPYYDIFSKDIAGVTHLCDDCEQRGLGGEGYFNCDSCQRRMVENITRERYCVEDGDGGIQCLACAAKQYFADPANQIEPQLVDTVSQGTDQAGLFNPETGNVELRRVKHVLGVGQSLPDGVKFVDNFENCNGAGRFDSRAILKAINEQKQPVFLVLDGAYQFSQSIGLYAKV